MIRLLDGHSLTVKDTFVAEKFALNLSERQSTATITIGPDAPVIDTGDWLQDEDEPGAGIVWRVKSIDTDYATDTRTLNCEHIVTALKDKIMFGDVTPGTMAGDYAASTCTAQQAFEYVLNQQSDFTLGTFSYVKSSPYNFSSDNLFDALETVSSSLLTPFWTYSFASYPFTLNVTQPSDSVQCEMRMDRNIRTLKKTIDRSRMYTRFYPIGKNNKKITGSGYVSKNENLYGVISNVETDNSLDTEQKLIDWANEKLQNHAEPLVTVTISGLELSEATGEPLDSLGLGTVCRVPLPEYNTTIEERITKLSWADKVADPESVTVTLANQVEDVASIVNKLNKASKKKNKNHAKQGADDHAWMVDTKDHIGLVAEAVAGEGADQDWSRVAQVMVDGQGVHQRVTRAEGSIVTAFSAIEATDSKIYLVVSDAKSDLHSEITQTASGIRADVYAAQSTIYSVIEQTASYFRSIYVNNTNHVWIQDSDPRTGGSTPKDGDVWIESTHQGTWDGAEGFDWDHDEDYDWLQVQGAKIWGWKNNKWELVSDQQQVVTMTDVEQTSEHVVQRAIKVMANDDGNLSVYRAELLVEGDRIRSEVHQAQSQIYSFILQTASQIQLDVSENNRVFASTTKPQGTQKHPLADGDVWVETNFQRVWADMEELDAWVDDENFDWSDLKGSKVYVYDKTLGDFREVLDEQVLAQDTDIIETSEKISQVARSVKTVDGKVDVFRAELTVKADKIESRVNQRIADVGSSITQTAREIRAEVHAAGSQIYSSISQTASQIRLEVANSISGVQSFITQTASQIRSEVNASNSLVYSTITQTASQIRSEVASSISGLQSSITQESNRISLLVEGTGANAKIKPASIVASINNGASSIKLSATHIDIDGLVNKLVGYDVAAESLTAHQVTSDGECTFDTIVVDSLQVNGHTNVLVDASVSGNTLTLTYDDGTTVNFSKATSLSAAWDGNRKFTVSASPQGVSRYTTIRSSVPNAKASWSNSVGTLTIEATIDEGETFIDVGTVTVNAPSDQGNSASNISLGSVEATTTRPSGTELSSWRNVISSAISGRKYFRFKATLTNGSGSKWYYINFE